MLFSETLFQICFYQIFLRFPESGNGSVPRKHIHAYHLSTVYFYGSTCKYCRSFAAITVNVRCEVSSTAILFSKTVQNLIRAGIHFSLMKSFSFLTRACAFGAVRSPFLFSPSSLVVDGAVTISFMTFPRWPVKKKPKRIRLISHDMTRSYCFAL